MAGFGPQQWAAFAAMAGQQPVGNAQAFQLGGVDSNGVVLGTMGPGYVRLASDSTQPSVMSGSSLHAAPYGSHPTLGYTLQPPMENNGRQVPSANLPPYLQHYPSNGPVSQALSFPHVSIPYGQSFPYIQPLLPALCNGGLSQVQQCQTIPQQQTALVSGFESSLRVFDSLKSFGALPQEQNRRTKSMITSKTNLYISGLNESDTDETVRSLVGSVVTPKSCKAMMNNGVCKGYGFIDCATEEDAEKAKNYILANAGVGGRKLLVKFAHENEKDVLNVYVRHLPADFTKEKLENLFRKYGEITSVKLLENEDRLTGIGFVRYARADQAERAIEQMNAQLLYLGGNSAPVMCKLADKPNTRRRIVASSHTPSALMSLPPLTNSVQRHPVSYGGANPQRIPAALSQQSNFAPTIPFNPSIISPLNQPQVILHGLHGQSASPQARAVLPSGVIPNGTPSTFYPIQPTGCGVATASSNRATPLIVPTPSQITPISSAHVQSTPNATVHLMGTTNHLSSLPEVKSGPSDSPTSKFNNQCTTAAFSCDNIVPTDNLSTSKVQNCTNLPTSQPLQLNAFVSATGPSAVNPQLLLLPQSTDCTGCTIQNPVPSMFPYFPCGSQTPSAPIPVSTVCTSLAMTNHQILTPYDSTVNLTTSELQSLTLKSSNNQHQCLGQNIDPMFSVPVVSTVVSVNKPDDCFTLMTGAEPTSSVSTDNQALVTGGATISRGVAHSDSHTDTQVPQPECSISIAHPVGYEEKAGALAVSTEPRLNEKTGIPSQNGITPEATECHTRSEAVVLDSRQASRSGPRGTHRKAPSNVEDGGMQ